MSYPDRLQLLNSFTLTSRRKYLLLSFVTKSLYKKVTSDTVSNSVYVNSRHVDDLLSSFISRLGLSVYITLLYMHFREFGMSFQNNFEQI